MPDVNLTTDYAQVVYLYDHRVLVIGKPDAVKELCTRLRLMKGVFVGEKNPIISPEKSL